MSNRLETSRDWVEIAKSSHYRVDELARLCGLSPRQVERFFLKRFDQSPKNWLREQRMQAAALHLQEGASPKQAAAELGFKDISHFYREFWHRFKSTPRQFKLIPLVVGGSIAEGHERQRLMSID